MELRPAIISHICRAKHDGSIHTFPIPDLHVWKCESCGEVLFDDVTDEQISQELRKHLNLLSPQEIRERLKSLGLTQRAFGERTGIAEETISRWLSGAYIQSRAYDNLMRFSFKDEEAKYQAEHPSDVIMESGQLPPWQHAVLYQSVPIYTNVVPAAEAGLLAAGGEWWLLAA